MLDVFGAIGSKLVRIRSVNVDNWVFRLHYRITTIILLTFSVMVTLKQYIGDPIDCLSQSSSIPANVMDQYCWVSTTFTLPHPQTAHSDAALEDLGVSTAVKNSPRTYHQYYQWVCFVLFLQALTFYVPHFLWRMWEGGQLKSIASGLELRLEEEPAQIEVVSGYLRRNFGQNNFYLVKHVVCEVLNLLNVLGQISFTNRFLGGAFISYGTDVISYSEMNQEDRVDPMILVFPRLTKCTFHTYGPSGDMQKHDALCVLPLNIINEKIYIFLWFWFFALALISGLALFYRLVTLLVPKFRLVLLRFRSRMCAREFVEKVNSRSSIGDWFFIYRLGCSIDSTYFSKIIAHLAKNSEDRGTIV